MGFTKKQIKAYFLGGGTKPISYPRKKVSFTRFIKLVKQYNYKGLDGFSLFIENPKPSFSNDKVLRFSIDFKTTGGTMIIVTTEKRILSDALEQLLEWCKQMYTFFHYHYGMIYEKKRH